MFQKAMIEEAKKRSQSPGLWKQLDSPNIQRYDHKALTVKDIQDAISEMLLGKMGVPVKKKRIRRKMKKHGKTI